MENLFIQSTINDEGQTLLEAGFIDGKTWSIPSEFATSSLHNNITISITRKDFWDLQSELPITKHEVLQSLVNQFSNNEVFLIIGSSLVNKFR